MLVFGIYKEDYLHIFKCDLLISRLLQGDGRLVRKPIWWLFLLQLPTDCPKSVRIPCVIEHLGGVFVVTWWGDFFFFFA